MKSIYSILFCSLFLNLTLEGFSAPTPVLLFLTRQDQNDTLGYNLVNELPALVYSEIMSGKIALWDSPEKNVRILPESLSKLEQSGGDEFSHAKQLFIYELWDLDKRKGDLNTVGFYFSNRTRKGDEISYGFVEYPDLDSILKATHIPSNANGNCELTYYEVLKNKHYSYNVVQVGDKKITNIKDAIELKEEVKSILSEKIRPAVYDCKEMNYLIVPDSTSRKTGADKSEMFLRSVQLFLNENPEVFYNLGGDRIRNFLYYQKITLSGIQVQERWKKSGNGLSSDLEYLIIYIDKEALDTVFASNLQILELFVEFKSVSDFLSEKEFYFRILKINDQEILESQSDAYLKGLQTWKWNQLTEFVRYE